MCGQMLNRTWTDFELCALITSHQELSHVLIMQCKIFSFFFVFRFLSQHQLPPKKIRSHSIQFLYDFCTNILLGAESHFWWINEWTHEWMRWNKYNFHSHFSSFSFHLPFEMFRRKNNLGQFQWNLIVQEELWEQ